jgi:ABC-type Fe3+/spermidine/putrescine transport system ATPase subunit
VLVLKPQILLMDEPLSNLDAKLRVHLRGELKDLQKKLGVTTIYVTHDQEEALSLSDYIAVMRDGRLEQMGTPREIYNEPHTIFAADFSGLANFIEENGAVYMARPEWIDIAAETERGAGADRLRGIVENEEYLGRNSRLRVKLDSGKILTVYAPASGSPERNSRVTLCIRKKTAIRSFAAGRDTQPL